MIQKILAISGSIREDSNNLNLLTKIAKYYSSKDKIQIDLLDKKYYSFPIFNEEVIHDHIELAKEFSKLLDQYDGYIISTAEYNGAITPLLKNIIDWASIVNKPFAYKPVLAMSSSPGKFGGQKALNNLQGIILHLGGILAGNGIAIPNVLNELDGFENASANNQDPVFSDSLNLRISENLSFIRKFYS